MIKERTCLHVISNYAYSKNNSSHSVKMYFESGGPSESADEGLLPLNIRHHLDRHHGETAASEG